MKQFLIRFVREDRGQDLIEYALLAAFIGTVGILAWSSVSVQIGAHYGAWDGGTQKAACMPNPIAHGGQCQPAINPGGID